MLTDVFSTHRPLLFSIAYRMLGSASDAEDVLQDAWLRFSDVAPSTIRSPKAFATTIVTRLCLDRLKSARATREEYVGPWLPEPVLSSEVENPATVLGRDRVLQFLLGLHRTGIEAAKMHDLLLRIEDVNSEPALIIRVDARLESVFVFSIEGDTVSAIRVVRNPDKLAHIDRRLTTH